MTVGEILPFKTKSSRPLTSYGVSVNQVERWCTVQIKPINPLDTIFKTHLHYLSLDIRWSEAGQCAEESGNVMRASLWDAGFSEAGFVLANSITYFNMSGSGNRAGPEPYFTYLGGGDNGTLLPRLPCIFQARWQKICYFLESQWKGLFLNAIQYLIR